MDREALNRVVLDLSNTTDAVYGVYLDGCMGFNSLFETLVQRQASSLQHLAATSPELATIEYLDSAGYAYGKGDPADPRTVMEHVTTQGEAKAGEAKARNRKAGRNHVFLANMCLVILYQFWEDHFRKHLADALGVPKSELKVPIFGDLRIIRNSIVHNLGIATSDVGRCEVLRWFTPGDHIELSDEQMEVVIGLIYEYVDTLPANKVLHPAASGYLGGRG